MFPIQVWCVWCVSLQKYRAVQKLQFQEFWFIFPFVLLQSFPALLRIPRLARAHEIACCSMERFLVHLSKNTDKANFRSSSCPDIALFLPALKKKKAPIENYFIWRGATFSVIVDFFFFFFWLRLTPLSVGFFSLKW